MQGNIEITISALLPIKTEVRPGIYLVSTVFKFHCNVKKFDKAFTLSLQHCVNLQSMEDCHRMCFIVQHGNTSDIKHGQFEVQGLYGSIALNAFCCISIAWMTEVWRNVNLQLMVIPVSETPDDQSNSQTISNSSNRSFKKTDKCSTAKSSHQSPNNSLQIISSQPNKGISDKCSTLKWNSHSSDNSVEIISKRTSETGKYSIVQSNEHSSNNQQRNTLLSPNAVDANCFEMPKEQEEVKKISFPQHKYEEMIALPKNHSSLAKWAGAYSVYVNKAGWRTVRTYT